MNILKQLFSINRDEEFVKLKFFGIKINIRYCRVKIKYKNNHNAVEQALKLQSLYDIHSKVFPQFKNINEGKDVVIIATGPTLAHYTEPIKGAVHIGLNRAYQVKNIKFDYLFCIDGTATKDYIDEIDQLDDVVKFYGLNLLEEEYRPGVRIPEYHLKSKNSYRYYAYPYKGEISPNIAACPLVTKASVSFPAIHFALWTHPKRIFLVGCDTTSAPYWDGKGRESDYLQKCDTVNSIMLNGYYKLKEFARICYPDVEIISINPVGLKGIFKDIYTQRDDDNGKN